MNATYTPSAEEIAAGTATVTLTTSDPDGACGAVSSTMTISIHPVAVVSTGENQTICSSGATSGLGGSVSGGTTTGE